MLLISDGARDGGRTSPLAAAQAARRQHVPVYTVSLGTPEGRRPAPAARRLHRDDPRAARARRRSQLIARTSGGQFFRVATADRLREVYEQLGSRIGHKKESREISDVFAGGGALLLLVGAGLSALWFRRVA